MYTFDIPSSPAVTEKQICRYLAGNLELVKERAKEYICREIDRLPLKELVQVFRDGRDEYGGDFDVETIPCLAELRKEAADTIWYVLFLQFQSDH